jgi:hypothetical protein
MVTIASCKDCFGVKTEDGKKLKYQRQNCPYEHAVDYKNAYDFFKSKWNEEFPELLQASSAMGPAANACKVERNAAMPMIEQEAMMAKMQQTMTMFTESMNNMVALMDGKPAKKQTPPKNGGKIQMWRPDVKQENIQDAIDQLKERHPGLEEQDIIIAPNKNPGHSSIRFKVPD